MAAIPGSSLLGRPHLSISSHSVRSGDRPKNRLTIKAGFRRIGGRVNVQIKQIRSDIVELLFNPHEEDLRVGENLTLREKGSDRGLIVQIIEFRTITYPSLLHEMMEMLAEETETTDMPGLPEVQEEDGLSEMSNLKLAIAKIRKVVQWTPQTMETEMERPRA